MKPKDILAIIAAHPGKTLYASFEVDSGVGIIENNGKPFCPDGSKHMTKNTVTLTVQLDPHRAVSERKLALAVYRAIEYALENDISGAEALNLDTIGQVSVKVTPNP